MADSTLDLIDLTSPATRKGRGTRALGPSDTSDSGSDLQGPGIYEDDTDLTRLDSGTNEDASHGRGAGRDIGDANLDSDTDSGGTGERASAGRDVDVEAGSDIAPDHVIGSGAPMPTDALDRMVDEIDEDDEGSEEDDQQPGAE